MRPSKKKKPVSAGRKKLAALGIHLPFLPTTTVGSLPKNQELTELRYKVAKGVQTPMELERKEKLATELWIRDQERLGLDIVVDGELNRGDFVSYFAKNIDGFSSGGTVRSYGNRFYKKPVIVGKLEWKGPITVDMWKFSQRLTHRPLKALVTGPYTLMDWSFNEYYSSRETICQELARILRKEVASLVEAGAKIIQIDEPALSARPKEFSLVADALKTLTEGLKCYFIVHHCYGNLAPIWSKMQRLPVDNLSLEATNSGLAVLDLMRKERPVKDVTIGVIESHDHTVEPAREIQKRIQAALKVIPAGQLWLSPDCGLKTRTTDEALQKLTAFTNTANKVRASLS